MLPRAHLIPAAIVLLVLTALAGVLPSSAAADSREGRALHGHVAGTGTFEARTVVAINRARARHGLRPITRVTPCLDDLSESWGARMAADGLWEHRDLGSVVTTCRLTWTGETLARGRFSPRGLVALWMDSSPHRAILLTGRARLAGIDVRRGPGGDLFAVLNLGDRR